jgi:hypothetical protein
MDNFFEVFLLFGQLRLIDDEPDQIAPVRMRGSM